MSTFYRKTARRVASLCLLLSDLALHAVIYWRKICRAWHQKTCMVRDVGDTAKKTDDQEFANSHRAVPK